MRNNVKRFGYSEAASKVGAPLYAAGLPEVPHGSRGMVVGTVKKSRGFNLLASFTYQRLTFGEADHKHELTRRQYEACRVNGAVSR